jgi:hypothetical protein
VTPGKPDGGGGGGARKPGGGGGKGALGKPGGGGGIPAIPGGKPGGGGGAGMWGCGDMDATPAASSVHAGHRMGATYSCYSEGDHLA